MEKVFARLIRLEGPCKIDPINIHRIASAHSSRFAVRLLTPALGFSSQLASHFQKGGGGEEEAEAAAAAEEGDNEQR